MNESERPHWVFAARLALGLGQGLALYGLYRATDGFSWPANDPRTFAPLLLIALYIPLLASQALGAMRLPTLALWIAVATLLMAWVGWYDRFREGPLAVLTYTGELLPTVAAFLLGFVGLFIAQALVAAGDRERRLLARYDGYFDAAWKMGVQLALAALFVAVFWGVLWLGAAMFELIRLGFLKKLLEQDWFWIPATALATAAAIELTDVRSRLVAGIRSVVLSLLGWLLPLLALIAVGFLAGLFVTGLAPLWATREAAGGLLTAIAAMVVLINAAYQNGEEERPLLLRLSLAAAMLALTPLAVIAGYALLLRVGQYGWTAERLVSLDCLIVAACYALGYGAAAILARGRGGRMAMLEYSNIAAAVLALLLLGALVNRFTDPMKVSTDDQIGRLRAHQVSAENFDYDYLQREGGRFGHRALEKLAVVKDGPEAARIREYAKHTLGGGAPTASGPPRVLDIARDMPVFPKGAALPPGFAAQDWSKLGGEISIPACLTVPDLECEAELADMDGDGVAEVIVVARSGGAYWWGTVMKGDAHGHWAPVGELRMPHCDGDLEALRAGTYKLVPQPPPPLKGIEVGDHTIVPIAPNPPPLACAQR